MSVSITIPVATVEVSAPLAMQRYKPTPELVAPYLRGRLKDAYGNEVDTWSTVTVPTRAQVGDLIDGATAVVAMKVGDDIPYRLWPVARRATALRAAADIERSYSPEQATDNNNSTYALFDAEYRELIGELVEAVVAPQPGVSSVTSVSLTSGTAAVSAYDIYDTVANS